MIAANTAVPIVDPMFLIMFTADVVIPISSSSALFCTAVRMIDITHPSPSPKTNKGARIQGISVSTAIVDIIMREGQCVSVLSRVIETATRLFMEKGYKGTKISDISAETGIHIGSIYNIFRDKEDIVCEIVIRDYALMLGRADRIDVGDLVKKVAYPMAAEFRLARLGPNVARILSVAYSSSKTMDALTDLQCGLLERYCEETGIPLGIDAIKRRMCAVNGLIGGLIACPSEGDVREDVRIAMEAYCCLFGVTGLYGESLVDEAIRLVELDPPEGYLPGFAG